MTRTARKWIGTAGSISLAIGAAPVTIGLMSLVRPGAGWLGGLASLCQLLIGVVAFAVFLFLILIIGIWEDRPAPATDQDGRT